VNGRAEYYALRLTADYVQRNVSQVIALSLTGTLGLDGTRSDVERGREPVQELRRAARAVQLCAAPDRRGPRISGRLTGQYTNGTLYSASAVCGRRGDGARLSREPAACGRGVIARPNSRTRCGSVAEPGAGSRFDWGNFSLTGFFDAAYLDNADAADPSPRFIRALA
jgi:hypothetical protein